MQKIFLFLLVHNSEYLENLMKNYSRAEWVNALESTSVEAVKIISDFFRLFLTDALTPLTN